MERIPVSSSNIASIGYDNGAQILEVEFHNGAIYQYSEVPEWEYEGLMSASSKGTYLHSNIKKYPYARL